MKLTAPSPEQAGLCFVGLPGVELYCLSQSQDFGGARLYVVLQGEIVVDLASGGYEHAKGREILWVSESHSLQPVGESMFLAVDLGF